MSIGGAHPSPEPAVGIAPNGLPRESVWDYPRPPAIRPERRLVTVRFAGAEIARSERALKICETAGPPVVYLPPEDVDNDAIAAAGGHSSVRVEGLGFLLRCRHRR